MIRSKHATSQEAWEWINEFLATSENKIKLRGGYRSGSNIISYDHYMSINKSWVDPEFDFGKMFGYKLQKWNILISNYIDFDFLDIARSQVREKEAKKTSNYTIGFKFANRHSSGHGCLLSLVFSRRYTADNPIVIINIRSSEVTKRLLMDFLLVERIIEYVYGEKHGASIKLFCGNMYLQGETFTMYHTHKDLFKLLKGNDSFISKKILGLVEKLSNLDPEKVNYKVHRRAVKRLRGVETSPLLAKNLQIVKYNG